MLRKLAGYCLFLLFLVLGGCVVYDPYYPGYYNDYPQYYPRHHYRGPPGDFRHHRYRGWHDGLNQEEDAVKSPFRLGYQDEPLICPDPGSRVLPTG